MPVDAEPVREVRLPGKIVEAFFDRATGLWKPSRYKVLHGGRGGAKSDTFARLAAIKMHQERCGVLCTRRYQNSILDSVHKAIADAIEAMGLTAEFDIQKQSIFNRRTGSTAIFKGTARSMTEIKSLKGIKYCWVEEAESVPKEDWQVLDPTIREPGSEIWVSYNPDQEDAATHRTFTRETPADAIVVDINWRDNPWFPPVLNRLRLAALAMADAGDPSAQAAYDWIWEGKCRRITDAVVFRNRVVIEDFDEPADARPFYGADWGFADDPTVLMRCYVDEPSNVLYVTHEAFEWHCEIDDVGAKVFGAIPGADIWPIKGDAANPQIISYLQRQGFAITAADKWPGSVEDGIAHMKGFARIVIHPRCPHVAQEFRLYSWKTDPRQLDGEGNPVILPVLVDRFNHGVDALRYSLDGYIQGRGLDSIWSKM